MQDFYALAFPRNISSIHENLVKTKACENRNATLKRYFTPLFGTEKTCFDAPHYKYTQPGTLLSTSL